MSDNIIRFLFDKTNKIENSQVKKPMGVSLINDNFKKRDENNKKSFKKTLLNVKKNIEEEKTNKDNAEDVIISSSLVNLIEESGKIGRIVEEEIASHPRLNDILKDGTEISSEPLEKKKRG